MPSLLQPLHLLVLMFAGWVNRHQLDVIAYLQEENRVFKERLGGRLIRFSDAERRRLARKAYALGRKILNELEKLITPDTSLLGRLAHPEDIAFAVRFLTFDESAFVAGRALAINGGALLVGRCAACRHLNKQAHGE